MASIASICDFCGSDPNKYICPKCGLKYCSLDCYKHPTHLNCSESFYRNCVYDWLNDETVDDNVKHRTLEILKRQFKEAGFDPERPELFQDNDHLNTSEELSIEERFEGIDIENMEMDERSVELIMSKLTEKEKKEFENQLKSGQIMRILSSFESQEPWYLIYKPTLITELNPNSGDEERMNQINLPNIVGVPPISKLTTKSPSPLIVNSIINCIFNYCYLNRIYCGEHQSYPLEAAKEVLAVSPIFSKQVVFDDPKSALQSTIQILIESRHFPIPFIVDLLCDTKFVVTSHLEICRRCLSDIILLFTKSLEIIKQNQHEIIESRQANENNDLKKQLKISKKKVEFFLSFTIEFWNRIRDTKVDIDLEILSMRSLETKDENDRHISSIHKKEKKKLKPIIEEI